MLVSRLIVTFKNQVIMDSSGSIISFLINYLKSIELQLLCFMCWTLFLVLVYYLNYHKRFKRQKAIYLQFKRTES